MGHNAEYKTGWVALVRDILRKDDRSPFRGLCLGVVPHGRPACPTPGPRAGHYAPHPIPVAARRPETAAASEMNQFLSDDQEMLARLPPDIPAVVV